MCRTVLGVALLGFLVAASRPLHAQDTTESSERPPTFSSGVAAGAIRFAGGRTEQLGSIVLQLQPASWLSFSTAPAYGRTSFGSTGNTGVTEIPAIAGAAYTLENVRWSPEVSASLEAALSTGSTPAPGGGDHDYRAEAALGGSPIDPLNLQVAWSRPLTATSGNPSLRVESALSLGRATATLGMTSELGRPDSGAVLSRSVAAGLAFSLHGPLTLTTDASRGVAGSAPAWTFALGVGTAFAGVSPLNPTSALKRLKQTFGSNVSATSGYGRASGGSSNCKKNGTC